ncbi:Toll/interleukin-1 receptor domain-containing protein [Tanacetum coccineum]|uniref:Toll/interleukin-1 receptor domain-containing protein n=1 Tax=Tanacetum coccineum TaxID=301880 RepID=A0ABQ5C5W3_9ASTR
MASTSASSVRKSFKYDVFLSFRGEDTRNTFVGHLYKALEQNGIETYKDDENIKKGETIDNQLIKTIEDSRFLVIVFSTNYASSSWCLDELVKIMECQKTTAEQTAYPIFYDVDPTEVRKQSGLVREAFTKHEHEEAPGKWREALKEAADLAGWELKKTADGDESKLIQIVVADIFKKLCSINSSVDDGKLVGMEMRINKALSSLEIGTEDVRMIGIKGIGGGGKTTLARAVFDQISNQFEGKSFVENVRESSKPSLSGLKKLQKQILMDVFSDQDITISSVSSGKNTMRQMLHRKKLLVVLDDVTDTKQLEALSGASNWFKPGSRIIITTRDEQVLVAHRVNFIHNFVHKINLLSPDEAICLFSRYAFGRDIPIEGYKDLSGEVVKYADGLPLTIKVLGSFLCGQDELEWKDALERLKTIPLEATMEKLEISYNGLEDDYKEIFLDIACLLEGWYKDEAIRALESCGFHARNGLRVLEQKSLIKVSKYGVLDMHDHIQEMGRHIVRRLHPDEPHRHSRLWIDEEIENILANDLGTEETKCIKVRTEDLHVKGLANLKKLRFLTVYSTNNELSGSEDDCYGSDQETDEVSQYLPNSLRFLRWSGYPFRSFPKTFQANNLVGLELHDSNIVQLWESGEEKVLYKLRFLDIFDLKVRTLDLRLTTNLEMLRIIACEDLVELRMPTESLKLRSINLTLTPNLDKLCLINCHDLVELLMPKESQNLRIFELNHSKLETLRLGITPNLVELILEDCNDLVELHMPTKKLILEDCNDLVELHMLAKSGNLRSLKLSNSKLRILDLGITSNLEELILEDCKYLVKLHMPAESLYLRSFKISHSNVRILDIGFTPDLAELILDDCNDLVELYMRATCLNIISLDLSYTIFRNLDLRITPNLKSLSLKDCPNLIEHIPSECTQLISLIRSKLRTLHLGNSRNLVDLKTLNLGITPNLGTLSLRYCHDLAELHIPTECLNLRSLELSDLKLTTLHFGMSPNLVELILASNRFKYLPDSICMSKHLKYLRIRHCDHLGKLPEDIGRLECLEELYLWSESIENLPGSICMLKHLKSLEIRCFLLEKLPEDIGQLKCLERLNISLIVPELRNCMRKLDV